MKCNRISRHAMGCRSAGLAVLAAALLLQAASVSQSRADETHAERRARIAAMSPQEKEQLAQKKKRFVDLGPDTQSRLRDFHESLAAQPNAQRLERTVANFYQWLGTLRPRERDEVLDPQLNADQRIARIRELLRQQEDERFRKYVGELPEGDRDVLNQWMTDFVVKHEDQIVPLMHRDARSRYRETDSEEERHGHLIFWWIWHYTRRSEDAPKPTAEDMEQLIARLSEETQRQIDQAPTPEERDQRSRDLVRALAFSRFRPQVPRDQLLKFYENMKRDDPRRERLEGLTGDELYRELARMHNEEPWRRGGGPAFGWGSRRGSRGGSSPSAFGQPGPPGGRGRRSDGRERGKDQPSDAEQHESPKDRERPDSSAPMPQTLQTPQTPPAAAESDDE